MDRIVARWEWRTFGSDFGEAEDVIRGAATMRKHLKERYVVSDASMATVKFRDHVVDVKLPLDLHATGLEGWSPTFRSVFPLDEAVIRNLFAAWNLRLPRLSSHAYTRDAVWNEIVEPNAALTPVEVIKQRHQGWLNRCIVEVTDVSFDGYATRSLAVISLDDPRDVVRTVRALGLSQYDNVNYVKALRHHVALRGCPVRVRAQRLRNDFDGTLETRAYV